MDLLPDRKPRWVLKRVRKALMTAHFDQVPQLECQATKRKARFV